MEHLTITVPSQNRVIVLNFNTVRRFLVKGLQSRLTKKLLISGDQRVIQIYLPGCDTPLYPEAIVEDTLMGERNIIVMIIPR